MVADTGLFSAKKAIWKPDLITDKACLMNIVLNLVASIFEGLFDCIYIIQQSYQLNLFAFLIGVYCEGVPNVLNSVQNGNSREYGSIITFQCLDEHMPGNVNDRYRHTTGETVKAIQCMQNGEWNDTVSSCECKANDLSLKHIHPNFMKVNNIYM